MKAIYKIGLAILSGLLISAAWPVNGFAPLAFLAFVPLLSLQDKIGDNKNPVKGNMFLLSLLAFITWNSLTTWWVWKSTGAGTVAMILLNSLFMTTVFWAYHIVRSKLYKNNKGYFVLIIFVLAFEYLHLHWQLNWPWLQLGHVFSSNHTWIQWYSVTGVAGGTIWVLLTNILIYQLLKVSFKFHEDKKRFKILAATIICVIFIPLIISKIMYACYEEKGEDVEIIVVQPNLDPYTEQFELTAPEIIKRNFDVALPLVTPETRFIVSPESAIQENIWLSNLNKYYSIRQLRNVIDQHPQLAYVIGISAFGPVPKGMEDDFAARKMYHKDCDYFYAYNTAILVDEYDTIQYYHKSRLTPGVEMMPSWRFLRPIENFAINLGGTVGTLKTDSESKVLHFKDYKVATLICYESAFGGYVTEFVKKGANLIVVITNDGWWGNTSGHKQHLDFSRLRAIETRRGIARSANTGISAFINQKGDIIEQSNYDESIALRNTIKTNDKQTFYVRYGDYLYNIAALLTGMLILVTFVFILIRRK